jgi:Zn-dependent peptidase ImmA (M78 family)
MNLQYISDNEGKTTGVFIPIKDWEELKKEIKGLSEKEEQMIEIPDWQKNIVRERMEKYQKNPDRVLDWDEVKDKFNLD